MKRHSSLALLSSDHQHGLVVAKLLKSVHNTEDFGLKDIKDKLIKFYKSELLNHFAEEEKYLVPPLRDNPLIKRMCEEHSVLKSLYELIIAGNDKLRENLISLGDFLDSHIRFEERELFPMIEKSLPEEELAEIGRKIRIEKGAN
jgi:hemerythrin-like domain-containing protein